MKYIKRILEKKLAEYLEIFPVTAVTGPRQSGKSTMLKNLKGSSYKYATFDDPLVTDFFYSDPKGFLEEYSSPVIFDEVQKVPEIFPYIKMAVDNDRDNYGKYILTGSAQFSLINKITESLAGRIGMLSLLPFQLKEIPYSAEKKQIVFGSYPELIGRNYKSHREWYASYFDTYIERDVRTLFNIGNLRDFRKFVQLLAARCSAELNMSVFSRELGVDVKTIKKWISVLEAGYIIFLLQPYHKNLGKRIVKRPKIYFYDTGLVCYLTGTDSIETLEKGPLNGPVFENYFIAEIKKNIMHTDSAVNLYYYRTNSGLECDLIMENKINNEISYLEIKTGSTPKYIMIENIKRVLKLDNGNLSKNGFLIYRGKDRGNFTSDIQYINYAEYLNKITG